MTLLKLPFLSLTELHDGALFATANHQDQTETEEERSLCPESDDQIPVVDAQQRQTFVNQWTYELELFLLALCTALTFVFALDLKYPNANTNAHLKLAYIGCVVVWHHLNFLL